MREKSLSRSWKRWVILIAVVAVVVSGSIHKWRTYSRAKTFRSIRLATQWLEAKDYDETALCLATALRAEPNNIDAVKLMAELLESTGSVSAITWRRRAVELDPANRTNRLDWAQTSLKFRDTTSAQKALNGLDEQVGATARYQKLAGALAWSLGRPDEAQQHYRRACDLEPDNAANRFNLATTELVSTNVELLSAARASLQRMATNGELALKALRDLEHDAIKHNDAALALEYRGRIVTNAAASFEDKLQYLSMLFESHSPDAERFLSDCEQQATNSPITASALGSWIKSNQGPASAWQWLSSLPVDIRNTQSVSLVVTECQVALKDWAALASRLEDEDWTRAETFRLAFESLALRSLGKMADAQSLWGIARRESTRNLEQLSALAQLTHSWGWREGELDVLKEIVADFPHEKWAAETLANRLHDAGETHELNQLLSTLVSIDSTNVALKVSFARVCLLQKTELPLAHRLAKEAYDAAPEDVLVICTYAYSLLLKGEKEQAVKIVEHLKPKALQTPWVAACYGIIEAECGNKAAASTSLEQAQKSSLLPEEQELVRLALAKTTRTDAP